MEVSRNRSWRPPANATSFSFGPWVTCHCAHAVVEEPEVRIHADEEFRPKPRTGAWGAADTSDRFPVEFKKPLLQLPEAAIPDREERKNVREILGKRTGTSSLKQVQLPSATTALEPRWKKVVTAALLLIVVGGLLLLGAGYLEAEKLAEEFKEYSCRLSSPETSTAELPVFHTLTPGLSCWVELEICDSGSCSRQEGWTAMTFENPKEFLSPSRSCDEEVKHLPHDFSCLVAPGPQGPVVVKPSADSAHPESAWEVETLLAARYSWAVLPWLVAWPALLCWGLRDRWPGARCLRCPSKQFAIRSLVFILKVCAMSVVSFAVAGAIALVVRYPAAVHLRENLEDGTCQLHGELHGDLDRHWTWLPAVQCSVPVAQGDHAEESLIFSFPTKLWDKQSHHLSCAELVTSLHGAFPCARAGKMLLAGHKADMSAVFLELINVQFEHPAALDVWCISVLVALAMLVALRCRRCTKATSR